MWEISIGFQTVSFLCAVLVGVIWATAFDCFRAVRKTVKHSAVLVFFEDLFLFLAFTFITFMLLMARCNGEVRGYILVGEAIGFILCRLTFSRLTLPFFSLILSFMLKIFSKINYHLDRFGAFLEKNTDKMWLNIKKTFKKIKVIRKNS